MTRLDSLEPSFKEVVKDLIGAVSKATGLDWVITSGRRTIAEQDDLYEQGRSRKGNIVTNAKGGQSPHNFGLAVDMAPVRSGNIWWGAPSGYWEAYGALAKDRGLVWGGEFKSISDKPHVETKDWKQTQALWKEGKISVV